ncbi:TlpA family protein disulfide reductase [Clostridiaceae bacterium]|nr:TlpA family protein disulfide reductase [Clostridiaceae bacterium]
MRKRKNQALALLLSGILCLGGCAAAGGSEAPGKAKSLTQESAAEDNAEKSAQERPGEAPESVRDGTGEPDAGQEPDADQAAGQPSDGQEARGLFEAFEAVDLEGNAVTQDVFAEHDLTMVNIWATFCGPCITEMPELGTLSEEYKDRGVQIVGLCIDVTGIDGAVNEAQLEEAKRIVQETGASYLHIIPGGTLATSLMMQVQAVPTTIFVDKDGKQVGMGVMGARDKEGWAEMIEELLAAVQTSQ